MDTIKEFLVKNPIWHDGTVTTEKKIRSAIKNNKLEAKKTSGQYKIFLGQDIRQNIYKTQSPAKENITESPTGDVGVYDLKEQHLQVKIKKDQQQLYEYKLLFAEQIKDLIIHEFHNPRIAGLTEVIRKHGEKGLIELWNQEIQNGSIQSLPKLQQALRDLILN